MPHLREEQKMSGYEDPQKANAAAYQQQGYPPQQGYAPNPAYAQYPPQQQQQQQSPYAQPSPYAQQQPQYAQAGQSPVYVQPVYTSVGVVPITTTTQVSDAPVMKPLAMAGAACALGAVIMCIVALTVPFLQLSVPAIFGVDPHINMQVGLFKTKVNSATTSNTGDTTDLGCDAMITCIKIGRAAVIGAMFWMFAYGTLSISRLFAHRTACLGFCFVIPWGMCTATAAVCEIIIAADSWSGNNHSGSGSNSNAQIFSGAGCAFLNLFTAQLQFGFFALQIAGGLGTASFIMECCYCCSRRNVTTTSVTYMQQPLVGVN